MADDIFYNDIRRPFLSGDINAVTLSTTDKALYPVSNFPVLGGQYFSMVGKKMRIWAFGKITTAATPGNGTFDIYYGTGADANGVILASSAALTLLANQSNISWCIDIVVTCRTTGNVGTLMCTGTCDFNVLVNAAGGGMIPANTAVVSGACDLTAANIISIQFKRTGSTAETMSVQELVVTALN